jgi:hypothetical protein
MLATVNATASRFNVRTMGTIFSGDPVQDMEIAKRLIARHPNLDIAQLVTLASDRSQPEAARIAAIYTLGFTDDEGQSRGTLTHILNSANESEGVKDHAAEALKSMTATH